MFQALKEIMKKLSAWVDWLMEPAVKWGRRVTGRLLHRLGRHTYRQQGMGILSLAVVLMAAALAVWVGYGLYSGLDQPVHTALAVEHTASESFTCTGYLVRQEQVIRAQTELATPQLREGQKAAAGETVAVSYESDAARGRQKQITELEERLLQLQYAGTGEDALEAPALLDGEIAQALIRLNIRISRGEISAASGESAALKGLVLRRFASQEELEVIRQEARSVQEELQTLRAQLAGEVTAVRAPTSGYFSVAVDGYESVLTPDTATTLLPSQLEALTPAPVPGNTAGKLISGDTWYFLCAAPEEQLRDVWLDTSMTVEFSDKNRSRISMTLVSISQAENGKCALLLAADRYLPDLSALRSVSARVVFRTYQGLQVPKKAVRVGRNGQVGVYVLEGVNAVFKAVEILYDEGETYVVTQDKTSTGNLWPGDEILLTDALEFEGKVVE